MAKLEDFTTPYAPNWCPGCGNFTIWAAFKNAAVQEGWDNTNSVFIADIGCNGHIINFTKMTSFEGLHGRPIPVAIGIKMANHRLNVFVFTGDGGCLGEGGNHFIHACRRNHDITVFLHDNAVYGLTTGQTSPASPHGYKSKSTPEGNLDEPIYPLALAIASGATFVARVYSGDIPKMQEIMIQANKHPGFAVVDILQPCVTFNKVCTHELYQSDTYYLGDEHDITDRFAAFEKALEWEEKKIPVGIFYKVERPTYESQLPQIAEAPLVEHTLDRKNLSDLFRKYT
jgi:2-oxoglutarate ferredoxin oxidoreductase subunit beta